MAHEHTASRNATTRALLEKNDGVHDANEAPQGTMPSPNSLHEARGH